MERDRFYTQDISGVFKSGAIIEDEFYSYLSQNIDLIGKTRDAFAVSMLIEEMYNENVEYIIKSKNDIIKRAKLDNLEFTVVVIGIGGSTLGIDAITSVSLLSRMRFISNIDPDSILSILDDLDLERTIFFIVSKSGNTLETVIQSHLVINYIASKSSISISDHFVAITSDTDNDIKRLALAQGIEIYIWPNGVGGRFSVFCISTLLPLAVVGLDIYPMKKVLSNIHYHFDLSYSDIRDPSCLSSFKSAIIYHMLYKRGFNSSVIMPYADKLKMLGMWYRQIFAESLGKNEYGMMPSVSIGTIDQHSMLELYLGGKRDKLLTIIKSKSSKRIGFQNILNANISLKISDGVDVRDMICEACDATMESLVLNNCPVMGIELHEQTHDAILSLMCHFTFEVIFISSIASRDLNLDINPFNQPNVDKSKIIMLNKMSSL